MTDMRTTGVDTVLDTVGMACPGPLMALIGAIRQSPVGTVIEVRSSDPGSETDIPAWVAKARHRLIETTPAEGYVRYVVQKER